MVNHDTDLFDVRVRHAGVASTLHTSSGHPFWSSSRKQWVRADQPSSSDRLATRNGDLVTVERTQATLAPPTAGISPSTDHDFYAYAGEGNATALVHNCGISMTKAVQLASDHVGGKGEMIVSGSKGWRFVSHSVDKLGNSVTRASRFDINPESGHVQQIGPHLNLETQINGKVVRAGALADPRIPIDSATIRPGDIS